MGGICPRCGATYRPDGSSRSRKRCVVDGARLVEDLTGALVAGRYLVEQLIGIGGQGSAIWRAMRSPSGEPVALKMLAGTTSHEDVQRFERGTRLAMTLAHPSVTRVLDYGSTADGALFQVMELLEGQTLHAHLGDASCAPDAALAIIDQVLAALEVAHARHIIHRDIKPANIFVLRTSAQSPVIKVLDFGLAKLEAEAQHELDNEITQQQKICGTPEYMAPEQIVGAELDVRTDLYAVGVLAYRLLTGRLPFTMSVRHELYQAHLMSPPPPFDTALGLPVALERVVMKALAKRPRDRFTSAAEMRAELFAVSNAEMRALDHAVDLFATRASGQDQEAVAAPSEPTPVAPLLRRHPPSRRWLWAACALIGLGGATWVLVDSLTTDQPAALAHESRP